MEPRDITGLVDLRVQTQRQNSEPYTENMLGSFLGYAALVRTTVWDRGFGGIDVPIPYGSKDLKNRVLGPKYNEFYCSWALRPYDLGPWTLRDS